LSHLLIHSSILHKIYPNMNNICQMKVPIHLMAWQPKFGSEATNDWSLSR
jgi:hypothetical protein